MLARQSTDSELEIMSMTQLVIGTALGFLAAQALLYGLRQLGGWVLGDALISGFVRYAPPLALGTALVTLGVWAIKDHLAAKRAHSAVVAEALDPAGTAAPVDAHPADEVATLASADPAASGAATATEALDPYSDPDFKVPPRPHRAGSALSLKDALVQRSEARARADLLRNIRQQRNRSQYDCEAAEHAEKYLTAGLDVWGFAAWELKYFPAQAYKGATLPQCKTIKSVADPSHLNLQSAVAQQSHP